MHERPQAGHCCERIDCCAWPLLRLVMVEVTTTDNHIVCVIRRIDIRMNFPQSRYKPRQSSRHTDGPHSNHKEPSQLEPTRWKRDPFSRFTPLLAFSCPPAPPA